MIIECRCLVCFTTHNNERVHCFIALQHMNIISSRSEHQLGGTTQHKYSNISTSFRPDGENSSKSCNNVTFFLHTFCVLRLANQDGMLLAELCQSGHTATRFRGKFEQILNMMQFFFLPRLLLDRWRTLLSVDDMVSDLITTLENLTLLNSTFIFFASDNGFHLGKSFGVV